MPEWLTITVALTGLALLVGAARLLLQWRARTRPRLRVEVFCNGSSGADSVGFTVRCWNEGGGHALRALIRSYLSNHQRDLVWEAEIDLQAGTADKRARFALKRPDQADLIPACNHDVTLYGRTLEVELHWNGRRRAGFRFTEPDYDPERDAARYNVKLEHWRARGHALSDS